MKFHFAISGMASLVLATCVQPVRAQSSGMVRTAESSGIVEGCVRWEIHKVPRPTHSAPQQLMVNFRLRNDCGRVAHVVFHYQKIRKSGTIDLVSAVANYRLPVGHASTPGSSAPYWAFNPPVDGGVNFWLFQFEQQPSNTNRIDMSRCSPLHDRRKPAPPCPPAFRFQGDQS